jgi:hypothetical protein
MSVWAVLGTPEIVTEVVLGLGTIIKPGGRAPEDTLQCKGANPPAAWMGWAYAAPMVPSDKETGEIDRVDW